VQRLLDDNEAARPECAAWLAPLRTLAQNFQFDRLSPVIQDALGRAQAD
jgi:hypothetical protein